jgi:hypothetical protein
MCRMVVEMNWNVWCIFLIHSGDIVDVMLTVDSR